VRPATGSAQKSLDQNFFFRQQDAPCLIHFVSCLVPKSSRKSFVSRPAALSTLRPRHTVSALLLGKLLIELVANARILDLPDFVLLPNAPVSLTGTACGVSPCS